MPPHAHSTDANCSSSTDHEYLTLVAMLVAPNRLNPARNPAANAERTSGSRRSSPDVAGREGFGDVDYEDCGSVRP